MPIQTIDRGVADKESTIGRSDCEAINRVKAKLSGVFWQLPLFMFAKE